MIVVTPAPKVHLVDDFVEDRGILGSNLRMKHGHRSGGSIRKPSGSHPTYSMLRNTASGPEIGLPGRILAGLLTGKDRNRPSGRPKAGRRADVDALPEAVWPKSGPEGRFTARKHYCVT